MTEAEVIAMDLEDGGRDYKPRNVNRSWKCHGNGFSPAASRKKEALPTPYFGPMKSRLDL